jgi:hypothetical protein
VTRFAWVLNLDAELELELAPGAYTAAAKVKAQLERYGSASHALLGPDDVLVTDQARGLSMYVGRAWCPTPLAVSRLRKAGATPEPHPSHDVLRRVNHRRFAFDLGGGLPGQAYVDHRRALESLLGTALLPYLLKRPLGFAGRGQLRVHDLSRITEKEWQWIDVSMKEGGLVVEPLVTPLLEVSLHGFVHLGGRYELGRPCVQSVSERGVFRDIRLAEPGELSPLEHHALAMQGVRVADALRTAGYFGPFGIDGYRYRLGTTVGFCSLGEINARYTMGFLTGFPRHPKDVAMSEDLPL